MAQQTECPNCGARNTEGCRRCRICTTVINAHVKSADRGLAALRKDVGYGTSFDDGSKPASTPAKTASETAAEVRERYLGNPEVVRLLESLPPVLMTPIQPSVPLWEPTPDGTDAEAYLIASTIVINPVLRNGRTPPPLDYQVPQFDPKALYAASDRANH